MFPYDFRDERMMKQLKEISQRVVDACPEMRRDIGTITHNLLNKVKNQNLEKCLLILCMYAKFDGAFCKTHRI